MQVSPSATDMYSVPLNSLQFNPARDGVLVTVVDKVVDNDVVAVVVGVDKEHSANVPSWKESTASLILEMEASH